MNRRGFIYRLAFIPPLIAVQLNSCSSTKSVWEPIQDFVRGIRNVILPSGDGITIESLGIEDFVMTMLKDCYSPEDQERFFAGQRALDSYCEKSCGHRFATLGDSKRKEITVRLNKKEDELDKDSLFLFSKVKSRIIQGFQQSELLMKDMKRYELIPARYNGHYKIS